MTHSHDTSTPAMSAETVPSEEFVLVSREPTPEMIVAGYAAYNLAMSSIRMFPEAPVASMPSPMGDALRAAISTLSASHLAKEGGEAGAVERAAKALYEVRGVHRSTGREWEAAFPADRFYCIRDAEAALASLPQPSPALAKGGDAVREALVPFSKLAADSEWNDVPDKHVADVVYRSIAGGEETVGSVTFGELRSARAALSTPTEGPASQTEGMGGDAETRDVFEVRLQMLGDGRFYDEQGGEWELTQATYEERTKDCQCASCIERRASLTPPETAEAVPVAYRYWDDVTNRWYLVSHRINAPSDAPCEPLYSRSASSQGGE